MSFPLPALILFTLIFLGLLGPWIWAWGFNAGERYAARICVNSEISSPSWRKALSDALFEKSERMREEDNRGSH